MLSLVAITPHPPIIIPEIGGNDIKKCQSTINTMEKLAGILGEIKPETIIIVSPHAMVHPDRFAVYASPKFRGDLGQFGVPEYKFEFNNDLDITEKIISTANNHSISAFAFGNPDSDYFEIDHGIMVPMYYLQKYIPKSVRIIPIAYSYLNKFQHYAFGQIIKEVCESENFKDDNIALIASGDLSHRLIQSTPAGFNEAGKEFDQIITDSIKNNNTQEILELDEDFIEQAGECGYRSILIALGALDNINYKPNILNYESPFGVGYLTALLYSDIDE